MIGFNYYFFTHREQNFKFTSGYPLVLFLKGTKQYLPSIDIFIPSEGKRHRWGQNLEQSIHFSSIEKPWLKYFDPEDREQVPPSLTMYGLLKENCRKRRSEGHKAILFESHHETYGEFFENIDRCADAFAACGIKKGDYVSFLSVSIPETLHAIYGLNKIGAVCNFIDVRTDAPHVREFVKKAGSSVLIVLDLFYEKVADYLDELGLSLVIVQSAGRSLPMPKKILYRIKAPKCSVPYDGKRILSVDEFLKKGVGTTAEEVAYEPDMPAAVTRTGGTTGVSKGVVLTNDSLNSVAFSFYATFFKNVPPNSSLLNFLPVGVSYGLVVGIHVPLALDGECILIPKFELDKFDDYIIRYRPNHVIAVPYFYDKLIYSEKLKDMDLSFLVTLASGGDSANEAMMERQEKFRLAHHIPYPITPGYGLSETSSAVAFGFQNVYRKGSVGLPSLGNVISVFEPGTTNELPIGEQGEVCITGRAVMKEYLHEPEETANVLWEHPDGKKWVHTGDIGYMDEDGFLYILGRSKRAIIRFDGHKMYPLQIEQVVLGESEVARCVVVGVPDRDHASGNQPLVVVEKKNKSFPDEELRDRVFAICKSNLELRSQPVAVEFVDEIPLTNLNKNDYRKLEAKFADYDYREKALV